MQAQPTQPNEVTMLQRERLIGCKRDIVHPGAVGAAQVFYQKLIAFEQESCVPARDPFVQSAVVSQV